MRTFIAIELPDAFRLRIDTRRRDLSAVLQAQQVDHGLRWVSTAKLHLTLRFLGETSHEQLVTVQAHLQTVAARHTPFSLSLGGLGCFPNVRRPSVIWLGISGAEAALTALQADVESAVQAAGFVADTRRFTPHLTLARVARDLTASRRQALGAVLAEWGDSTDAEPATVATSCGGAQSASPQSQAPATFNVHTFAHIQSRLQPDGAVYSTLAHFPLGE